MRLKEIHLIIILLCSTIALHGESLRRYDYTIVESYPHSTSSYTQGLQIVDGELFEGTGMYGESRLLKVDLKSGKSIKELATLPNNQFGEGITILGDTIYMLTWREGLLHMFDKETGRVIDKRRYGGEGWGLTSDGEKLYMSDGSNRIVVRDRVTFKPLSSHSIVLNDEPLTLLNELEWIEGRIWANIYTTNSIAIINPESWEVEGLVDLTGLLPDSLRDAKSDVLNGIAYDERAKKIYVTGKYWSRLFEIEIFER